MIFITYLKVIHCINFFLKKKISLKYLLTFSLIGMKEEKLYRYGKLYSNTCLYGLSKTNVINNIKKFILENKPDKLVILSGGYEYYMYEFLDLHKIKVDHIISSKINTSKTKFISGGLKIDCMHYNKRILLKEKIDFENFSISFFTDDIKADISIIDISNNVFIIKNDSIEIYRENENNKP